MTQHIIPISGKDSVTTALIQTARQPDLPYEYVFCDVGVELPETYEWLEIVERQTGWKIQRVGRSLEAMIKKWNFLPSGQNRFCTKHGKIIPLEKFHGKGETFIYYGLRADEARVGVRPSARSTAVYPLVECGIDLRGVWTILNHKNLLPPAFFWPSLYYRVIEMLGPNAHWVAQLAEWEQRMLFAGRTRANCFWCFYQRQYEYVWLAETHPDLFARTCWIERFTGGDLTDFHWKQGYYIGDKVMNERQKILDRRAKEVCGIIDKRVNGKLWGEHGDTEIALTSCGLLCGK